MAKYFDCFRTQTLTCEGCPFNLGTACQLAGKTAKVEGKYGVCYLEDCLPFMHRYANQQLELLFSDTVWGHDYQDRAQKPMGINQKATKQDRIPYDDHWDPEFHRQWFREAQRISRAQVVCVGRKNKNWWIEEFKPIDWVTIYYKNGQGSTAISRYSAKMDYYCFGDLEWWKHHKFHRDVYEVYIHNGFLRDNDEAMKHPSPKDYDTWAAMIGDLGKEEPLHSIYDPFAGSCTIGEVAESLGISWIATELKTEYMEDIAFRIARGQTRKAKQQKSKITGWIT
jgi:hypothetical protein